MNTTHEPVALGAAFTALVNSVLAVLVLAGMWDADADLVAGVNLVAVNVTILISAALARSKVTPV